MSSVHPILEEVQHATSHESKTQWTSCTSAWADWGDTRTHAQDRQGKHAWYHNNTIKRQDLPAPPVRKIFLGTYSVDMIETIELDWIGFYDECLRLKTRVALLQLLGIAVVMKNDDWGQDKGMFVTVAPGMRLWPHTRALETWSIASRDSRLKLKK